MLASAVMAASVLRPWACVLVRREREKMDGDGDAVPFQSHLAGTEKWGRGDGDCRR